MTNSIIKSMNPSTEAIVGFEAIEASNDINIKMKDYIVEKQRAAF